MSPMHRSLFNAGLATNENLTILFGDSSIVSNTIFALQRQSQRHLCPKLAVAKCKDNVNYLSQYKDFVANDPRVYTR